MEKKIRKTEGGRGRKHRLVKSFFILCTTGAAAALFLCGWTVSCERYAHVSPSYAKQDISHILEKEALDQEDYRILYLQTGLGHMSVDKLLAQGRKEEIYGIQNLFFQSVHVECEPNTVISREEYLVDEKGAKTTGMHIVDVEDGDILITFCSHTLGWRNGHAALVTDARNRLVLEAQVLGSPSVITSLDRWESYPSFMVLRLTQADLRTRREVAAYARQELTGVPYRLEAGIRDAWRSRNKKDEAIENAALTGTHCSHLVWYAYRHFGYDLDSDKGLIVTPEDIAGCENLEVVQSYGIQNSD